jgi:hypothetical protein
VRRGGGPPPLLGAGAALVVLAAGIVAAVVHDEGRASHAGKIVPTTLPPGIVASTETTVGTPARDDTASPTTVRSPVPSPEAATNGLWASYTANNRDAAARFAVAEVIDVLFATPYTGEQGVFQGCHPLDDGTFDCEYRQRSTRYVMTAQADHAGTFKIVRIEIGPIS